MSQIIFALSSASGKAGVAVIRLSGENCDAVVRPMIGRMPAPGSFRLATIKHPTSGEVLDRGICLFFKQPHSFTGEDVIELHVHGSKAVVQDIFSALRLLGCRLADAGEFTRRAFAHGKMDLTAVEGLADLLAAETSVQRQQALANAGGALGEKVLLWREKLVTALAHLEAYIDFPDEGLDTSIVQEVQNNLGEVMREMSTALADRRAERLRDGLRVVIIGAPNVGKSSLLNALAQRDVVIVSDIAGTTRDAIELPLDIGGYPVILTDTAGIHEAINPIEQEGIRRSQEKAREAELLLMLRDGNSDYIAPPLTAAEKIYVVNKSDLLPAGSAQITSSEVFISAKTGGGLDALLEIIYNKINQLYGNRQVGVPFRERQRDIIASALEKLKRFSLDKDLELQAEDLRGAVFDIGRLTGRVDTEDLLDIIFSDFCIGK